MPRRGVLARQDLSASIDTPFDERRVAVQPVLLEVQIMLDEQSARIRVVADAVAANPWVDERKRQKKQRRQPKHAPRSPWPPFAAPHIVRRPDGIAADGFMPTLGCCLHRALILKPAIAASQSPSFTRAPYRASSREKASPRFHRVSMPQPYLVSVSRHHPSVGFTPPRNTR